MLLEMTLFTVLLLLLLLLGESLTLNKGASQIMCHQTSIKSVL